MVKPPIDGSELPAPLKCGSSAWLDAVTRFLENRGDDFLSWRDGCIVVETYYDKPEDGEIMYARWLMLHWRLPAYMKINFREFIEDKKLFCTYELLRYRCTGGSRMGGRVADNKLRQGHWLRD